MRLHTIAAAAACAVLLSIQHVPAEAASAKSKKSGSARSVAAAKAGVSPGKASRSEKSASVRTGSRDSKSKVKLKGVRTVALAAALPAQLPVVVPAVPLTLAQLDVARLVQTGVVDCEMGRSVVIEPQAHRAGAFQCGSAARSMTWFRRKLPPALFA